MIFLESEPMSLSEAKWKERHFLAALYPVVLEDSTAEASKEMMCIDLLARPREAEA